MMRLCRADCSGSIPSSRRSTRTVLRSTGPAPREMGPTLARGVMPVMPTGDTHRTLPRSTCAAAARPLVSAPRAHAGHRNSGGARSCAATSTLCWFAHLPLQHARCLVGRPWQQPAVDAGHAPEVDRGRRSGQQHHRPEQHARRGRVDPAPLHLHDGCVTRRRRGLSCASSHPHPRPRDSAELSRPVTLHSLVPGGPHWLELGAQRREPDGRILLGPAIGSSRQLRWPPARCIPQAMLALAQ